VHILLVLDVVNVHPPMLHHWSSRWIQHILIPILMEESPKPLICAPLLVRVVAWPVPEGDDVSQILCVLNDHFLDCVSFRDLNLQALKLLGRVRSATTRRGILERGLSGHGPFSLGKLFVLGSQSTG
jgi:hypothetical protein